eukprot:TRINITY_DN58292_c0_g1_i1.p1 TRINITY_DN58292_c0_g1~~TRINITY_DN58292_c0_g1_i1.p1  ORF type:complete len:205 (-),score=54.17 TRINITY_DN58292_c0_g1_i1:159-773(-)
MPTSERGGTDRYVEKERQLSQELESLRRALGNRSYTNNLPTAMAQLPAEQNWTIKRDQACAAKVAMVHQAKRGLENLHEAMVHRFSELDRLPRTSSMHASRTCALAATRDETLQSSLHAEQESLAAMEREYQEQLNFLQQRLAAQQASAQQLRQELLQVQEEERLAREAELRLVATARIHDAELRGLREDVAAEALRASQLKTS